MIVAAQEITWPAAFAIAGPTIAICLMVVLVTYFENRYSDKSDKEDKTDD